MSTIVKTKTKYAASRIGKLPVALPDKVKVTVTDKHVRVEGPLGQLERDFVGVTFEVEPKQVRVHPEQETQTGKALHGLGRSLLNNMVTGVSKGFQRDLDVVGTGFKVEQKGPVLVFTIGFSHPVTFIVPDGVKCDVEKSAKVILRSTDRELIGATAARIRGLRPPEPYKGKGIRYSDEVVRKKAGKSGSK